MKKNAVIFVTALMGCTALWVSGCNHPEASTATTATTAPTAAANGAINQYCAVETGNKIDPKGATYVYKGKTIGFCCPDCIDTFKKDPEKYMATLH